MNDGVASSYAPVHSVLFDEIFGVPCAASFAINFGPYYELSTMTQMNQIQVGGGGLTM